MYLPVVLPILFIAGIILLQKEVDKEGNVWMVAYFRGFWKGGGLWNALYRSFANEIEALISISGGMPSVLLPYFPFNSHFAPNYDPYVVINLFLLL